MKDPTFCAVPRPTMYSSHFENPFGPVNPDKIRREAVSSSAARSLSLIGPRDEPSPWMAVVIPWVIIEIALPSPVM
jgi:hypothetical protein